MTARPPAPIGGLSPRVMAARVRRWTAASMWEEEGVPASFAPVIYALVISWLGERDDPSRELREASSARSVPFGLPRPPRGWRSPR